MTPCSHFSLQKFTSYSTQTHAKFDPTKFDQLLDRMEDRLAEMETLILQRCNPHQQKGVCLANKFQRPPSYIQNHNYTEFSQLHFQKSSDLVPKQHLTLDLPIDFQQQGDAPNEDLSEEATNTAEEDFSDHHQFPFEDLVADLASEIVNKQKSMDPTPFFFDSPLTGEDGTEKSQAEDNHVVDPMSEGNKFTAVADSVSVIIDEQKVPPSNSVSIRSETSLPCFEISNSVRFSAFPSLLTPIINSWSHSVPSVERDGSSRRLLFRPPRSMIELPPWFYLPPKPPDKVAVSAPSLNPSLPVTTANEFAAIQYPAIYSHISLLNALQMFDQRPRCLVAVWRPTITGCTGNGHEDVASNLFKDMHQMEVKPGNSLGNALAPLLAQSNEFAKFFTLRNATWTSLLVIRRWAHTVLVEALLERISTPGIPASSLMTFLNKNPGNSGVILNDYGSVFVNNSSHSQLDGLSNVSPLVVIVVSLVAISFVFAFKLWNLLSIKFPIEGVVITPKYSIIKEVAIKLDDWSKACEDITLSYLFMMTGHCQFYNLKGIVLRKMLANSWLEALGKYKEALDEREELVLEKSVTIKEIEEGKNKIIPAEYACENTTQFLSICLGMQLTVIKLAQSDLGAGDTNSNEYVPNAKSLYVIVMPKESKTQLSIFIAAKSATNEPWLLKIDDDFPDHPKAYWTDCLTSWPASKSYTRLISSYCQAARQLKNFKRRKESGPPINTVNDAVALSQHHDVAIGTERQHVAANYTRRVSIGIISYVINLVKAFQQCLLPTISYCHPSETSLAYGEITVMVVYNHISWKLCQTPLYATSYRLTKGYLLLPQHVEMGAVFHRKMIDRGRILILPVLLKWKTLPLKHGTKIISSLRTRMLEGEGIVTGNKYAISLINPA